MQVFVAPLSFSKVFLGVSRISRFLEFSSFGALVKNVIFVNLKPLDTVYTLESGHSRTL